MRWYFFVFLLVSRDVFSASDLSEASVGSALYEQYCQSCHGPDKAGLDAFDGNLKALQLRLDGYTENMPDFSGLFSAEEVTAIYAYLMAEDDVNGSD